MERQSVMAVPVAHDIVKAPLVLRRGTPYRCRIVRHEIVQDGDFMRMLVHWEILQLGGRKPANDSPKREKK